MNQHASDAPQDDSGELTQSNDTRETDSQTPSQSGQPANAVPNGKPPNEESNSSGDEPIRVGSPFAVDPIAPQPNKKVEVLYDVGPTRYTAMGAVVASVMVLGFAAAAAWWFPTGGALIAALGCVLSIFGMYSAFRKTASGLLAIHLGLFILCYGRSIG